jgi:carbohydrate-binding DOMON domain-containing protein
LSAKEEAVAALKEAAAALQEAEKQSAQAQSASNDLAQVAYTLCVCVCVYTHTHTHTHTRTHTHTHTHTYTRTHTHTHTSSNELSQALETAKHDLKVAIAAKETAEKKLGERTSKSHAAAGRLLLVYAALSYTCMRP